MESNQATANRIKREPETGVCVAGRVSRVIDGDTVEVTLTRRVKVRLVDCWAPEVRGDEKVAGEESRLFPMKLLPEGQPVKVDIDTNGAHGLSDVMTFDRVLAEMWVEGDDSSISDQMVEAGYATREKPRD
ncbi:MAG: hypothetical protein AAF664_25575 [Planctomycetota bacterium]